MASRLALFLVGIALVVAPLHAQETDEVEGEIVIGPQYLADTDNRDSAKFEEFREVPNGFVAERFRLAWTPRPELFFDLHALDVGQDDQRLLAEFGKVDLWRGSIRWAENPRRWTDEAFTLYAPQSGGVFTLEDSFQSAVRAAAASSLPAGDADADGDWDPGRKGFVIENGIAQGAQPVTVEHQRQRGGASFEITPTRHWAFKVTADRERRDGTAPQNLGMYFSNAPVEIAAPVDFRTDWTTTSAEYLSRRFTAGVELMASSFDSGTKALTWDNQMFLVDEAVNVNVANPGHGRMTYATDNELQRVALRAGVNLPARTRIDASFATSETTQDDLFLPMTINTQLVASALPATSLDGKYETTAAQLRASGRPLQNVRWNAWWRSYELDNQSPSLTFLDYVATDVQFGLCGNPNLPCDTNDNDLLDDRIQRRSLPYGYKRDTLGALAGWSPLSIFEVAFSYEREDTEREFSAVESAVEDSYKLMLDFDVAAWLTLRGTVRRQERRADEYHVHYTEESFPAGEPYVAAFNEGGRKFYWTDRDRDSWALQVDLTPAERWGIYLEASVYKDDYFDPETGLPIGSTFSVSEDRNLDSVPESYDLLLAGRINDDSEAYALGFSYSAGARFDVWADYTIESQEYALASRYRNVVAGVGTDDPLDDWSSAAEDDYDTASVGFNWAITEDRRWMLRADASHSVGTSLITTDFVPGGSASGDTTLTEFPEVDTRLTIATVDLERAARHNLSYLLRYWYERWDEDNFASDFNEPYMGRPDQDPGSANAMFLGIDFEDYTNHFVSFLLQYRF